MKGFTPVSDILMDKYGYQSAAIYGSIFRYCQMENKHCEAAIETIGKRVGMTRRTVHRYLKALIDDGYITDLTPDHTHKPHIYICTDKLEKEESSYYTQGVQILHTSDELGVQKMSDRYANIAQGGVQICHTKKVVKETIKETTTKDNNEVEINFDLPRYDHLTVENKWVYINQGSDNEPVLVRAFANRATPKKLECVLDGQDGKKLYDPSKVFYQNGGPGLNGLKVGEPKSDGPKLSTAELAMKNRLIDLMGFDSTFAVPNHQIRTEMQLIQESAIKSVKNGYKPEFIDDWEKWYHANDWRGKRGDKPTLKILRETWKQFEKSNVKAAAPKVLGEF